MKRFFRERGLGIVLIALFLTSWAFQAWTGGEKFQAEQQSHGESAEVFGQTGYVWCFGEATFENWQSEFLQLLAFVVFTSFLIFKASPESRDGQDEMIAALERSKGASPRSRGPVKV
jgi:hypothetical protein